MWKGKKVAIVFPAYNEEPGIRQAIEDFLALRDSANRTLVDEVIVVDNNSKDRTAEYAEAAGARVVKETKQGYGHALQRGIVESTADLTILCEPDGTFVARDVFKLLAYSEDFEMVCGTRTTRELLWEQANMGWFLRNGNVLVAKFFQVLYGTCSLSDCGCTFRLISKKARDEMQPLLHVGQSHFLPNMVIAARIRNLSMIEIPLNYRGRVGVSKITGALSGVLRTGFRMIGLMIFSWPSYLTRERKT